MTRSASRAFSASQPESFENLPYVVTPAKAGVQKVSKRLDTGFRRGDDLPNFVSNSMLS
jgi:hypothetical protein